MTTVCLFRYWQLMQAALFSAFLVLEEGEGTREKRRKERGKRQNFKEKKNMHNISRI